MSRNLLSRRLWNCCVLGMLSGMIGCSLADSFVGKSPDGLAANQPDAFESVTSLARLSESHGQQDQAGKMYREILRKDPQNRMSHHRLGVIAARNGDFEKAHEHFQIAQAIGPPSAAITNDIGYAMYLQGELEKAEEVLQRAIDIDPDFDAARTNLGLVLGAQGRLQESLEQFSRVVTPAEARVNLAYVRVQLGDVEGAQREYHEALAGNSELRTAAEALVQLAEHDRRNSSRIAPEQLAANTQHERPLASEEQFGTAAYQQDEPSVVQLDLAASQPVEPTTVEINPATHEQAEVVSNEQVALTGFQQIERPAVHVDTERQASVADAFSTFESLALWPERIGPQLPSGLTRSRDGESGPTSRTPQEQNQPDLAEVYEGSVAPSRMPVTQPLPFGYGPSEFRTSISHE